MSRYPRPVTAEPFVLLCESADALEADLIRSTLEAKGIRVWVFDAGMNGVLGPINGVLVRPRIQVMEKDLPLAAKLVEPIVGPLDALGEDGDMDSTWDDPMRPMPEDPGEASDDADADPDDLAPMITPKKIGVPLVLSISAGLVVMGLSHLYARKRTLAGVLFFATAIGWALLMWGQPIGLAVLAAAWVFDLVGGIRSVREYNEAAEMMARLRGPAPGDSGQGGAAATLGA